MMKICDMNTDIQEFWADSISKYIEMRSIIEEEKSKIYDNQSISLYQQTPLGLFKHLSKDKLSKMSSKKMFDNNSIILNDIKTQNQNNNELSKSNNILLDFEEQKNILLNMDIIKKRNTELINEKNDLQGIIDENQKEIKSYKRLISALKEQNQELKTQQTISANKLLEKSKKEEMENKEKEKLIEEKILNLENKKNEYENEITKLNKIIKDNEIKYTKEKKILETKIKLSDDTLSTYEKYKEENIKLKEEMKKLENENTNLKTYKEYKQKYEDLLLSKEENNQQISNYDIENITETKEKLLLALKNNINIQKDNERLRKEIASLKEEIKNNKKEIEKLEKDLKRKKAGYINSYENFDKEKKEIDYKLEYEKVNTKLNKYKFLLDNKDKQIEKLEKEIENKIIIKNKKNKINNNEKLEDENKNDLEEHELDTENSNKSYKAPFRNINKKKYINNIEIKINLNNKDNNNNSLKAYKNRTNDNININHSLLKEDLATIKSEKSNYINNNKIIKKHSKSVKKKERIKKLRVSNNNMHSLVSSNLSMKNQVNTNSSTNNNNVDNLFINASSLLNLSSSVNINNIMNISDKLKDIKDYNINIEKKNRSRRREIRSSSNEHNKKNNKKNSLKNINNISDNNNIKSLLDKIHLSIKKDKKNQNEFISFIKKINKELNMNLIYNSNKKMSVYDNKKNSNHNINNEDNINEKNQELKELKNQLNISKRKETDIKLRLTFLQSEKTKLEEEKNKLQEEIKRLNQSQKSSNILPELEFLKNQKNLSSTITSDKNIILMKDIGRLTANINISPKKDIDSYEAYKNSDKNIILNDKTPKYSFRKKKSLNKSPSLEAANGLTFKKLFSDEKNSNYEEEQNNNNENNLVVLNYKNKINELMIDNTELSNKINNLNNEIESIKLKGNNIELINSNLIKENVELKQSLILIKDNYEKEYSLVSSSLINLTEKYQQIKKELKQKNREII